MTASHEDGDRIPLAEPAIGDREVDRASRAIESGQLARGEEVDDFESAFAEFCDVEHAVGTSNGTTALHAALRAFEIGDGDRVVTSPFTFVATANAVRLCGAEPVFADVDMETFNLDPHAVRATIREHDGDVDAILAVHLYGLPAAMDELRTIADEYDAALIEDAAQAHGARFKGRPVGSLGDAACFSFYPTKNMTTGEGGAVVTDDDEVARRCRQFVDHGRGEEGLIESVGHNFRMTDIAAAIGRVQLEKLPTFNRRRRVHARRLTETLDGTSLITPVEPPDRTHVYHQYTIRTQHREELVDHLDDAGIGTGVYYPRAIHQEPAYSHRDVSLPVAERSAEEVLSLPVHPALSESELERITAALATFTPGSEAARSLKHD